MMYLRLVIVIVFNATFNNISVDIMMVNFIGGGIGPIGSFYIQVNDTGSREPLLDDKLRTQIVSVEIGITKNYLEDLHMIIPGQFGFNCPSGFREEAF
jgi:hypothetical protein